MSANLVTVANFKQVWEKFCSADECQGEVISYNNMIYSLKPRYV